LQASLRYLIPTGQKPIYLASEGGSDAQLSISAEFAERSVLMHDARQFQPPAELDREGFALHSQVSAVEDFYHLDAVREAYEAELRTLLLACTGASDLLIFDHTLRSDSPDIRGQRSLREVASVIHNDYSDASAVQRLRDLLPADTAALRLQQRFAIVNVWRSIAGPVLTSPLACCDARTIAPDDLVASERRARERTDELELVCWNPAHRWCYFPAMRRDEVLLIKTFDSSTAGPARRCVHTAFSNPEAPADARPRESIESRALIFY
jgi:hypothetical protein